MVTVAATFGAVLLAVVMVLYVLLALGLPLGEYAMGGKYRVMPGGMRVICAVSVLVQALAAIALLQCGAVLPVLLPLGLAKGIVWFFTVYFTLNTAANGFSRSKKERFVITPLSICTAACFYVVALS